MGDTSVGIFNFRGDQYPTNGEVFRYMSSRRGQNNQPLIIREMASKIHAIWQTGDGCPFSVKTIIDRYHKLMKERKVYLAPLYALTHPKKQSDPGLSDFTKKHRLPSSGREKSQRQTVQVLIMLGCRCSLYTYQILEQYKLINIKYHTSNISMHLFSL